MAVGKLAIAGVDRHCSQCHVLAGYKMLYIHDDSEGQSDAGRLVHTTHLEERTKEEKVTEMRKMDLQAHLEMFS